MKIRRRQRSGIPELQAEIDGNWYRIDAASGLMPGVASPEPSDDSHPANAGDALFAVLNMAGADREKFVQKLQATAPVAGEDGPAELPLEPKSFRDFMLFEKHVIDSSRGYVRRFMPGLYPVTQLAEKLTGKPFPAFRPHKLWYRQPIYYLSNHLNFAASGTTLHWPAYTDALDYELELGAILSRPLFNATTEEAAAAIGGFVVLNDISARDVQKDEMDSGFGPQKAKHFLSSMSDTIVTADEILPTIASLNARVLINGSPVAECSTTGMQFSLAEAIAFASNEEQLHPGELFGSGTIPGGTGMENGRWLKPGDTVCLQIDGVGEVCNTFHKDAGSADS